MVEKVKSKFVVILLILGIFGVKSQTIEQTLDKLKSNYQSLEIDAEEIKIITKFHLPGNFKTQIDYGADLKPADFLDYISYDTLYIFKKSDGFVSHYKKTTFIPETFGDEIDVWLKDIPDPFSADLYNESSYELLDEIAKMNGTKEFYGKNNIELKINVNKLGHLTKKRDLFTRDFIKSLSIYLDPRSYLITGYSFEVILNPKSHINMKHDILFSDYRKKSGILLPTKIKRYTRDIIKSSVTPELRNEFFDRIDDNIEKISNNRKNCSELNNELKELCNNYWKKATQDFILMKEMINSDVFELEYDVIDVIY